MSGRRFGVAACVTGFVFLLAGCGGKGPLSDQERSRRLSGVWQGDFYQDGNSEDIGKLELSVSATGEVSGLYWPNSGLMARVLTGTVDADSRFTGTLAGTSTTFSGTLKRSFGNLGFSVTMQEAGGISQLEAGLLKYDENGVHGTPRLFTGKQSTGPSSIGERIRAKLFPDGHFLLIVFDPAGDLVYEAHLAPDGKLTNTHPSYDVDGSLAVTEEGVTGTIDRTYFYGMGPDGPDYRVIRYVVDLKSVEIVTD